MNQGLRKKKRQKIKRRYTKNKEEKRKKEMINTTTWIRLKRKVEETKKWEIKTKNSGKNKLKHIFKKDVKRTNSTERMMASQYYKRQNREQTEKKKTK